MSFIALHIIHIITNYPPSSVNPTRCTGSTDLNLRVRLGGANKLRCCERGVGNCKAVGAKGARVARCVEGKVDVVVAEAAREAAVQACLCAALVTCRIRSRESDELCIQLLGCLSNREFLRSRLRSGGCEREVSLGCREVRRDSGCRRCASNTACRTRCRDDARRIRGTGANKLCSAEVVIRERKTRLASSARLEAEPDITEFAARARADGCTNARRGPASAT